MDYFFPAGIHKFPENEGVRKKIHFVFVERDKPLDLQEESWLQTLVFSSSLGPFNIYDRTDHHHTRLQ